MKLPIETPWALLRPIPAALILALALARPGRGEGISANISQNNQGQSSVLTYVDWSASSNQPNHANFDSWTNPFGSVTKFASYNLYGFASPTPGRCFEMETMEWRTNTTADPIIWVKNGSGVWVKLADDIFGTQAFAKIFVNQGSGFGAYGKVRFAPYSSIHNSEAFRFETNWRGDDFNTCTNTTYPTAYVQSNGTVVVVRAQ